jgi:hypothetical protein
VIKIALLIGVDRYPTSPLSGCEKDAQRLTEVLSRNHDQTPNFECRPILSSSGPITRSNLRQAIEELFTKPADAALFYFAGHGTVNNLGGYLVTPDAKRYDEGVSMADVLTLANNSPARERIVILDCCHSGALGQLPAVLNDAALLKEGVSILSASRDSEKAKELNGGGVFTSLVYDALNGGAADVCGRVTVASIYAYADQALGGWDQRPLLKSHVTKLVALRTCAPAVDTSILRLLPKYFSSPQADFPLDPSYEPDAEPHDATHEEVFGHLQRLRAAHLVVPVDEEHMYYAAMHSKACRLTALGAYYWHLANSGKL